MTVPAIPAPAWIGNSQLRAEWLAARPARTRSARSPGTSAGVVGNALAILADDLLVNFGCHKGGRGAGLVAVIVAAESGSGGPYRLALRFSPP